MAGEITVPDLGESISEATISKWLVAEGDSVERDQTVAEVDTDKVSVEIPATDSGTIEKILAKEGQSVKVGDAIARLGSGKKTTKSQDEGKSASDDGESDEEKTDSRNATAKSDEADEEEHTDEKDDTGVSKDSDSEVKGESGSESEDDEESSPSKRKARSEAKSDADESGKSRSSSTNARSKESRPERRVRMTSIRKRIAQRMVESTQQSAMLTTFNEIDMSALQELRDHWREKFEEEHGVRLGLMSFFVMACVEALREYPRVNARIDGSDIVYHEFTDIAIAVSTEDGLVAPVLRNVDQLSVADIERHILDFAQRAQQRDLSISELSGGTFTITNGGVFGSLLSTPILNPPQTGILGMHTIQDRPVAVDGAVEIRPMMYVALTYDHRMIDGREAVLFLKRIVEIIEDPERLLLDL